MSISISSPIDFSFELTPKVTIDTSDQLALVDLDAIERALTRILGPTVTAAAVQLANVLGVEVLDGNGTTTVMLENFVFRSLRASSVDIRGTRLLLECSGVLTHIHPPDVVQSARAEAMYTLAIVRANDGVGKSSAILKEKYGVRVPAFSLLIASAG